MSKGAILLVAATVTCLFYINYCATVFQCGCTWLWAGADAHCNMHATHGKRCPWCSSGMVIAFGIWAYMVLAQALVSYWPAPWSWKKRLILATATFPAAGAVPALVLGLWTGYWY